MKLSVIEQQKLNQGKIESNTNNEAYLNSRNLANFKGQNFHRYMSRLSDIDKHWDNIDGKVISKGLET